MHVFTHDDRCDRCGAQAFNRVEIGESELFFCNHHYGKYEEAFMTAGYLVESDMTVDLAAPVAV